MSVCVICESHNTIFKNHKQLFLRSFSMIIWVRNLKTQSGSVMIHGQSSSTLFWNGKCITMLLVYILFSYYLQN